MHDQIPPVGAHWLGDQRTRFCVWAPRAERVELVFAGTAASRCVQLEPIGGGYHAATVEQVCPGARYLYRLDGGLTRPDPASRFQPEGVHGPSQVIDPTYAWSDGSWRGRELKDLVLYELHVGTFTAGGRFADVVLELDALVELGVTAVEIMPVAQFPGSRNWGYDGVYPFAVHDSYGGPNGFKQLVDACHARGLAVVLDVVYNHLGPEGNYLADFGPYFTERFKTPWGPAINFEGPDSDPVRRFFIENALGWVREFHVDGLRLDAIHAIVDQSPRKFLAELADAVHAASRELQRPAQLIAENNRNDPRILEPTDQGGLGLDAQWCDDFGRALQALLTGERQGFYADFGRASDLARAYQDGYVLTGQYSHYRRRRHGASPAGVSAERLIAYAQCHDQVGNRPRSDRLSTQLGFEQLKVAAAALLLSPYPPLLFMGEEYGETAPFHYFVSHADAELIERVRAGRRREFAAFQWSEEPADPQAERTFLASKLNHALRHAGQHRMLWQCYRELLQLRRTLPALISADRSNMQVEADDEQRVLLATRQCGLSAVLVILNFGQREAQIRIPGTADEPAWQLVWQSRDLGADEGWSPVAEFWTAGQQGTIATCCAAVYQRQDREVDAGQEERSAAIR